MKYTEVILKTESQFQDSARFDFSVLRRLRKEASWTLAEIAEKSGVSVAVLSKLERNQTRAELDTLFRLARAYEMNTTDLLRLAESPLAERGQESTHQGGGFHFRRVASNQHLCQEVQGKAGAKISRPEVHRQETELCWVFEGTLQVTLAHERYELTAGHTITFEATQTHTYEALTDVRFLLQNFRPHQISLSSK